MSSANVESTSRLWRKGWDSNPRGERSRLRDFQSRALGQTMRPFPNAKYCGGEGGIRTHGGFDTSLLFESSTFNHSDTSPSRSIATAMAIPQTKKPRAINGSRFSICTPGRIRTCDLLVRNQTLYPLSYGRIGWLAYAFHNQRMIAKRLKEGQPALQLIESSSGSFAIQVDTFGLHRYYPLSQVADRVREHV
jgi:hypothetical protein